MAPEGWVWLARVKRTQGRKGEVFAEILTDFPEKFAERRRLWLLRGAPSLAGRGDDSSGSAAPLELELVHHWMHKGGVVLHFGGVESITAAEDLVGTVVAIPRAERAQLEEGDVYIGDLIGCVLADVAGDEPHVVGQIEDVDRGAGPVAMLVVRPAPNETGANQGGDDDEILIPFAKEYLRSVNIDAKRVEMALPGGLADLNRS